MKTCSRCGEQKPLSEFRAVGAQCKPCLRIKSRKWYEANKERKLAKAREWYKANPERRRELGREWYAANPEKFSAKRKREAEWRADYNRTYRENNRERMNEWARAWRAKNADAVKAQARARYAADREKFAAEAREWRAVNREQLREYHRARYAANPQAHRDVQHRRRAQELRTAVGPIDFDRLWESQNGVCGICAEAIEPELRWPNPMSRSIDHVIPLSLGGSHTEENVQWAHLVCNLAKGNRPQDP